MNRVKLTLAVIYFLMGLVFSYQIGKHTADKRLEEMSARMMAQDYYIEELQDEAK